jgi:hypothetical protein
MAWRKVKKGSEEERNQRRPEGKSRREVGEEELEQVGQTCLVKGHASLQMEARNHARQVVAQWVNDQIGVRDAEIMWMQRRRQLLFHEKVQLRKWQTRTYIRCMKVLNQHEGAEIIAVTPDM